VANSGNRTTKFGGLTYANRKTQTQQQIRYRPNLRMFHNSRNRVSRNVPTWSCQMYVGLKPAISRSGQGVHKNFARCLATLEILFCGVTIDNVMGIIGTYKIRPGNRVSLTASMHTTRFKLAVLLIGAQGLFRLWKLAGLLYRNTCKQRKSYGLEGSWWRPSTPTFTNIRLTNMNVGRTICLSVKSAERSYSWSLSHNKLKKKKKLTNQLIDQLPN